MYLGLRVCVGWQLQGQLVVGLPGEARPFPGLIREEELTLTPRVGGQWGLTGLDHLGRDKGSLPALSLFFQEQPQRKDAASLLQTQDSHQETDGLAWNHVCSALFSPHLQELHGLLTCCSLSISQVWALISYPLSST